jgi:hypothetical protein
MTTSHDPLCTHHATPYVCDCNFIRRVRADQDKAWKTWGPTVLAAEEAGIIEAEVRERVVAEIKAVSTEWGCTGLYCDGVRYGLERAARVVGGAP